MDESQVVYGAKSDVRAEIDMSAPFESVKEAVCRFGGVGYWKPSNKPFENEQHEVEEITIDKLEEQATQLENDLILKKKEALDLLEELESTRTFVEDLKMEIRKEISEEDKENIGYTKEGKSVKFVEDFLQAERDLSRTTKGISRIRASMEIFNKKLERTRERLKQNSLKMSSVEERLSQTTQKLRDSKDSNMDEEDGNEILKELQILNSEAEEFKKMGEAAKAEILRTISKIERRTAKIRTAESKGKILKQVKEATEEIKNTKFALEEALNSMEAAKREEAAEKWGWEYGKNMEYRTQKLVGHGAAAAAPPSIGQILSRKLFLQEELMPSGTVAEKGFLKGKVSLAQMLGKQNRDVSNCVRVEWRGSDRNQSSRKRKKSGMAARLPFLGKQNDNQKRKKPTPILK
ncbi:WEB family protein At3g51720-like [Cucurbita moschata]|uniref:WEB family protein At3g51720-like n=1 Tax=Cucurbita moschata TaxID=3662 RepID=A0A6J1F4D2_CUCMO|nr:WEB family protein At3g51720-like [Cucurbita moschata]